MGRIIAFVAIAVVTAICVYDTFAARALPSGDWGISSSAPGGFVDPRVLDVTRVSPHSPADRAGIRSGDVVRVLTPRFFSYDWPAPGDRMDFEVAHRGATRIVTLEARARTFPPNPTEYIIFAMEIVGLLLASLLAWRKWNDGVARPLMLYLVIQSLTLSTGNLPGAVYGYFRPLDTALIFLSYAALIRFTATYPDGARSSPLRRALAVWLPAIALAMSLAFGLALAAVDWLNVAALSRAEYRYASFLCADVLPLAGLILGALSTAEAERRRLLILIAFFLVSIAGPIAYSIILALGSSSPIEARPLLATLIVLDIGYVYMILRHRMFDIAFVLNRAAIYAALTTVFVPLFALLEWGAERYISGQNRTENLLVQAAIVLVLFIAVRRLHESVERFVDRWLFRERHENETALREFAQQVLFMHDERKIASRAAEIVAARTGASWSAVYADDGGNGYALRARSGDHVPPVGLDRDDPAVLAAHVERGPVENPRDSALGGTLVLPLFARGKLAGLIVCGGKETGEAFAPDERDALAQLAHGVAVAADGVRVADIEARIAKLEEENARLTALPER